MRGLKHILDVTAEGEAAQRVLREGAPEIGWGGDPFLVLAYNKILSRWEVWDTRNGLDKANLVIYSPPGARIGNSLYDLLVKLRDGDMTKKTALEIANQVILHNEKLAAERHRKGVEELMELHMKMGYEIAKLENLR